MFKEAWTELKDTPMFEMMKQEAMKSAADEITKMGFNFTSTETSLIMGKPAPMKLNEMEDMFGRAGKVANTLEREVPIWVEELKKLSDDFTKPVSKEMLKSSGLSLTKKNIAGEVIERSEP
jgi:hypothetical protein